jgi:hypothetical protein
MMTEKSTQKRMKIKAVWVQTDNQYLMDVPWCNKKQNKNYLHMKSFSIIFTFFAFLQLSGLNHSAFASNDTINLAGRWRFQTDASDVGISEKWFFKTLSGSIKLPGSMPENGLGDEITLKTPWTGSIYDSSWFFNPRMKKYREPGNIKIPFWLTPVKYYVGPAWYQKEVIIPDNWKDKRIVLYLERPHWETKVWVDNQEFGIQNSLSTPHQYDITSSLLKPGKHIITIRIDNRTKEIDPGKDSHSITDQTQGNWNGIVGQLKLFSESKTYIDDIRIFPDLSAKNLKAQIRIKSNSDKKNKVVIDLSVESFNSSIIQKLQPIKSKINLFSKDTLLEVIYLVNNDLLLWDEFNPALYKLSVSLTDSKKNKSTKSVIFGIRDFKANGTRFEINGKPIFLRGTVENCDFPLTGYPPMDEASWTRVFQICRKYGLNHMRFHSYCPPEAAFVAADKIGFYLQPEGPSWCNHGTSLGNGKPIDKYIYEETERIVKEYGNHPSFCMFAYGNEPAGNYVRYLNQWVYYWKQKDNRRLYTGASIGGSWQIIPESEFLVRAKPRGIQWDKGPNSLFDYQDRLENQTKPYISHEIGQYCAFPNFKEIKKYTGPLKAKNFELFQEDLKDHFMGDQSNDFMMASGKLQVLCYKAEIEAALRTPGFAGFQLLSLNDYSGQGSALVGMLDVFWDEKGYLISDEFTKYCNQVVPLVRIPKFVYTNDETFTSNIEIANFSGKPIENEDISWKIYDNQGNIIFKGSLGSKTIPIGNCFNLGTINQYLSGIQKAGKLTLKVIAGKYSNSWNFWVYPSKLPELKTSDIHFCDSLDSKALDALKSGGKVFLQAAGKVQFGKDVIQYFTPVFWNTSWFKMRPPHTTGILCNPQHPCFADFPTGYHSDLQWWELLNKAQVMQLDSFPAGFKPLLQPIDTWFLNRKLGMIFEAKIGKGKILVCSADLQTELDKRPVARQLLYSLEKYMLSDHFDPEFTIDINTIKDIFDNKNRSGFDSRTKDSPDEIKKNTK